MRIQPWQHRSSISRDPDFGAKAARVLDLYARRFDDTPLRCDEFVISADEKTSIQARIRRHATLPPAPGRRRRVEHEYDRGGALQYLAAWDVRAEVSWGVAKARTGIEPFGRLVRQVMTRSTAPRTGGATCGVRCSGWWTTARRTAARRPASGSKTGPTATLVHTPVHASWLNQVEIYFSVLQRKVLTPSDFRDLQ